MGRNKKLDELRKQYRYTQNNTSFGVPAQVAGTELEKIREEHGHLSTSLVVDAARPEKAPLHPAFEWNDATAAERFRRHQASTLIRAVVVVSAPQEEVPDHRPFVLTRVADQPKPVYVAAAQVISDDALFADALARLQRKLQDAQSSVDELVSLAKRQGDDPDRIARLTLAIRALEAAGAAVADLKH